VFDRILIANRGEIARRIIATCKRLGVETVAVYSEADADALHVVEADQAVAIGPSQADQSYLAMDKLVRAAQASGAQAIHPGYGFLSENATFARAVTTAGLTWIGAPPHTIESMGDKVSARELMARSGVPVAPGGQGSSGSVHEARAQAAVVGYPVMVKAAAGGGGIGMSVAWDDEQLAHAWETTHSRAGQAFGDPTVFVEKFFAKARHVEVQILADAEGRVSAVGDRECSVQRRHQKVIEECPAPGLGEELRRRMHDAAVRAADSVDYRGVGTVEFLVSGDDFVFLEMNTRLQVEHPVTELVHRVDLVEQQLRIAVGDPCTYDGATHGPEGSAIELRVYAEDPVRFLPRPGTITTWRPPTGDGIRVDAGYQAGDTVSRFYDPLVAKLCAWGHDRPTALARALCAVDSFVVEGLQTNLALFPAVLGDHEFVAGAYDTTILQRLLDQ
jgi:acetyl-CoA carboxylase biotin carboxylase subunit